MTTLSINVIKKHISGDVQIRTIEDAGDAIQAIKAATRGLWPDVVFQGEPGFDDDGASEKPRGGVSGRGWGAGWTPKPGSLSEKVLSDARAGKTVIEIADAHDVTTQTASAALARLRKAGLLTDGNDESE